MDSIFIEAILDELNPLLTGALVEKVYQPAADTVIFKLWTGRKTHRLLISAASGRTRIHLTKHSYPNPPAPPRFCQLLRARLARLSALDQVSGSRVVRLSFEGENRSAALSGGRCSLILMAELLDRRGNLVLIDDRGLVIDALKRVEGKGGSRQILPGKPYLAPTLPAGSLLGEERIQVPQSITDSKGFERWLLAEVGPMSPLVARDLALQVEQGISPDRILEEFRLDRRRERFSIFTGKYHGRTILSAVPFKTLVIQDTIIFSSPSLAADAYFGRPAGGGDGADEKGTMERAVRRQLKRLAARKKRIDTEKTVAEEVEGLRLAGELLLANMHRLRKGMTEIRVDNYYVDPPEPMDISLDARLSAHENAEKYFQRYKKVKRSREHIARRLKETEEERDWLESVLLALEEARTADDLAVIRRELIDGRLLRPLPRTSARRRVADPRRGVREAFSPGGYRLLWGTGNRVNDLVSRHLCKAEDLWFHALDMPGCHLVLKRGAGDEVPEADRLYAASLAAGYSRGKNEGKVEVMVTEGKWVKKPKGAKPGLVSVAKFQTLVVAPTRLEQDGRDAGRGTRDAET